MIEGLRRWTFTWDVPLPPPEVLARLRAATALFTGEVTDRGFKLQVRRSRLAVVRRETAHWTFDGDVQAFGKGARIAVGHGGWPSPVLLLWTAAMAAFAYWTAFAEKETTRPWALAPVGFMIAIWWSLLRDTRDERREFARRLRQVLDAGTG